MVTMSTAMFMVPIAIMNMNMIIHMARAVLMTMHMIMVIPELPVTLIVDMITAMVMDPRP